MAAQEIGRADCPVCGFEAKVSEAKTGRAVLTCGHCMLQVFARGNTSDGLLRGRVRSGSVSEPAKAKASKPAPAPVPVQGLASAPTPAPAPVTMLETVQGAAQGRGFGLMGGFFRG